MVVARGGGSVDNCDDLFLFLKPPSVLSLMSLAIPLGFSPFSDEGADAGSDGRP
ncbi:hypothetical protein HanXRQr2_Chr15g0708721 [Helianthus annuus]|uniref:Uncharacterized protein n=1 Tax=Helianthus annuus TaxID=4232 RepID=A0A9K3E3Z2_HELAN|nr:hypothetical protein HanXRQr2_Chr15g0708721 [Helianthus annuus]